MRRYNPLLLESESPESYVATRMMTTTHTRQIVRSAYVHVPFCQTICGYCDFYSVLVDRTAMHPLVDALIADFQRERAIRPVLLDTIFVGGGTPTTLPAVELRRLLSALHAAATSDRPIEFTVEANPATVTTETAATLVESGVTRVSIGAQSFDTAELRVLERIHHPPQVAQTVDICRAAGISQVNLDLIFAVPGQSVDSWRRNLEHAIAIGPDHLSCYALTYERGTPLFDQREAGDVKALDEDTEAEMYELTIDLLAAAGYAQYEISNFAKPGCECRHNLVYWRNEPYLGIGPSAAGFVDEVRYKNIPDHREYVRAVGEGRSAWLSQEKLSPDQRARETMMLSLRLNEGLNRSAFRERFGNDPTHLFSDALEKHAELGLLTITDERIVLTPRGRLLANSVIAEYL